MIHDMIMAAAAGAKAPPTFVASAKAQGSTGASTIGISKPAGVVDGDLMIAFVGSGDSGGMGTWTPPAGWTELRDQGTWPNLTVAYKVASSEGSSYTFTCTDTGGLKSGVIAAYRGAAYDTVGTIGTASNGANCTASQITVAENNSILLAAFFIGGASKSFPTPSGMSSVNSDTDGFEPSWNLFSQSVSSGASGSRSSDPSGTTGSVAGVLLSIKPA